MPAVSKAQQQAAGAALAAKKKGATADLKGPSKQMAKMSKAELEKVASTKHKGLKKHVEEADLNEATLASNVTFWVVEKAQSPSDIPPNLVFETDPLGFVNQMRGGLTEEEVYGFYLDEADAQDAAYDQVEAVFEAAKSLEEKKEAVTTKIEGIIKKLQEKVNSCMEEGRDEEAQTHLQKISELRSKSQMVEASKKQVEKLEEGLLDRLTAKVKGAGAQVGASLKNVGAYVKGDKDAIEDPKLAKNIAILKQKASTLKKDLDEMQRDLDKLFPADILQKLPKDFIEPLTRYLRSLQTVISFNNHFATGNIVGINTTLAPKSQATAQTTTAAPTPAAPQPTATTQSVTAKKKKPAPKKSAATTKRKKPASVIQMTP